MAQPKTIPDEVHVHFLVQHYKTSYENIYQRFGHLINEKGMMITEGNLKKYITI
jgi:hypothetical protein